MIQDKQNGADEVRDGKNDIVRLLEENSAQNKEILESIAAIKKHIRWTKIWSGIRLVIIILPLVLGLLYFLPIVRDLVDLREILDYYRSIMP